MPAKIRLGRFFGIPVRVDLTWFLAVVLIGGGLAARFAYRFSPPVPRGQLPSILPVYWMMGIGAAVLLFLCVLLHELSHAVVARARGLPINGITLFLFGGVAEMSEEPTNAKQEFLLAAAGPLMSAVLAGIFYAAARASVAMGAMPDFVYFLETIAFLNIILVVFNVLPGFPLDGGRILRAILWHSTGSLKRATYISTRIGVWLAFGLMAYGGVHVLGGNWGGLWLVLIGFFLKEAADRGYEQVLLRRALAGVTVGQVMTSPAITVPAVLPLDRLVDEYFLRHRFKSFPVEDQGQLVGTVSLDEVKAVPRERWPEVAVVQVMRTDILGHCTSPDADVGRALATMVRQGLGRLPVCVAGRPVGVMTRRDIMELFRIRTELGD